MYAHYDYKSRDAKWVKVLLKLLIVKLNDVIVRNRFTILLAAIFTVTAFATCTKKWEDHNQITDPAIKSNLMEAVQAAKLNRFSELLIKSGFDKIITSSKNFTIWAPTDSALRALDPAIESDSTKLRAFVGNHISNQSYVGSGSTDNQRIKMLNGKFNTFSFSKFDDANILTANLIANNGIIHIVDKIVLPVDNIWEFVNKTTVAPLMKNFLLSLNRLVFDPANATQTGVNPFTGLPIYDTLSGLVSRNSFLDTIAKVNDESKQFTLILLTDNAFTTEYNKLSPWFKTSTADSTTRLTGSWLVKDLVFEGVFTVAQLTDTMISKYGVKVPVNKSLITASYKTSNGIIHVLSKVDFNLTNKFPPLIIEGENPSSFAADRFNNTFYRIRSNPNTGVDFKDILITGYNFSNYWVRYQVNRMNTMRYNAYWVAVNDFQTTPTWNQRLGIDSTNSTTNLPAVTVTYQNYNEVFLGQFTINNYRSMNLFVIGPNVASTNATLNVISLDYIKLVPAF